MLNNTPKPQNIFGDTVATRKEEECEEQRLQEGNLNENEDKKEERKEGIHEVTSSVGVRSAEAQERESQTLNEAREDAVAVTEEGIHEENPSLGDESAGAQERESQTFNEEREDAVAVSEEGSGEEEEEEENRGEPDHSDEEEREEVVIEISSSLDLENNFPNSRWQQLSYPVLYSLVVAGGGRAILFTSQGLPQYFPQAQVADFLFRSTVPLLVATTFTIEYGMKIKGLSPSLVLAYFNQFWIAFKPFISTYIFTFDAIGRIAGVTYQTIERNSNAQLMVPDWAFGVIAGSLGVLGTGVAVSGTGGFRMLGQRFPKAKRPLEILDNILLFVRDMLVFNGLWNMGVSIAEFALNEQQLLTYQNDFLEEKLPNWLFSLTFSAVLWYFEKFKGQLALGRNIRLFISAVVIVVTDLLYTLGRHSELPEWFSVPEWFKNLPEIETLMQIILPLGILLYMQQSFAQENILQIQERSLITLSEENIQEQEEDGVGVSEEDGVGYQGSRWSPRVFRLPLLCCNETGNEEQEGLIQSSDEEDRSSDTKGYGSRN